MILPSSKETYTSNAPALTDEHRQFLERRAVSERVATARGYWSATNRSQLTGLFPKWQRRLGLVVPSLSPDDATVAYQLRPNTPITRKDGSAPKYESRSEDPITLDVNPLMLEEVRSGASDLWVTEGAAKVDALASAGEPAVGGRGVYMFAVPGTKGTVALPCWAHVRTHERTVRIVFDADSRTNPDVQEALRRLVVMLEGLGARVLVVYLPPVNGDDKAGVDDYLAGGGTVAELKLMAQPFKPVDIARERIGRNPELREALESRRRILEEMPLKTIGQNTRASVLRVITLEAEKSGRLVERGGRLGIRVAKLDRRTISERSGRSLKSTHKAIEALEDEADMMRDNAGRKADRAGAFVLFVGSEYGNQYGSKGDRRREFSREGESFSGLSNAGYGPGDYPTRSLEGNPGDEVPALRWPKVILWWARSNGRRKVAGSHYVWRLGEKRGQILRHVLEGGGRSPESELLERFGGAKTRPYDFRRWTLAPLTGWRYQRDRFSGEVSAVRVGEPLVDIEHTPEGVYVVARPEWREALEEYREKTDEIKDAERQRKRYAEQRRKYRRRGEHPADREGELMGAERMAPILEEREREAEQRRIEEQRIKAGTTPAVFLADELQGVTGVLWRAVSERWIERGGKREDLRRAAVAGPYRFQQTDGETYLYHAQPKLEEVPRNVRPLHRRPENLKKPETESASTVSTASTARPYKNAEGVYVHPPDCACEWCEEPLEPGYARPSTLGGGA